MKIAKRILLFLIVNFFVIMMISIVLRLFHIQPYLNAYGLDYPSLMVFCLIWGMGGAFISLALSRKMAKWMMRIHLIHKDSSNSDERQLSDMIERLSRDAGLRHVPEVGIFQSAQPNAFATGPTQARSLVAVSTGLLTRMNKDQLEGVLAHEISHIANGDMVTMTLLQGIVNAFVMFLARALAYTISSRGRGRGSSFYMLTFLFQAVFMILGSTVVAGFSRFREFRADKGGADLTSKEKMISALKALQGTMTKESEKSALNAFMISRPSNLGLLRLFATHPPLEERIKKLQA